MRTSGTRCSAAAAAGDGGRSGRRGRNGDHPGWADEVSASIGRNKHLKKKKKRTMIKNSTKKGPSFDHS